MDRGTVADVKGLSSRERMLAALSCDKLDHVPCCFMLFQALQKQCADDFAFFDRQRALGIDVRVELPDVPMRFDADVSVRTWIEPPNHGTVPTLHKEYRTPAGTLETQVRQTEDWPHADAVPLFDDFLTPRTIKYLVGAPADLAPLRHLLVPPNDADIAEFRKTAAAYRHYAEANGLLLSGGWRDWRSNPTSVVGDQGGAMLGIDALMWLCGPTAPLYWAYDEPGFLEELVGTIAAWDEERLQIMLDVSAELIIERAWYSGTEFWSPRLYRQFVAPHLHRKVTLTHQAGAKFGYIMTSGMTPLLDDLLNLGIDTIIGIDPVQGKGTDLVDVSRRTAGRMCLWGGVSAPMSVEHGDSARIWQAVENAISVCGERGGFILSPVDNILDTSSQAWQNVLEFIKAWGTICKSREASGGVIG